MGKDYADMEIRTPGSAREIEAAASLFDAPLDARAVVRFLASDTHHLLIAYEDERPVGFVTGVEMTHPDKGTEIFVYELGVLEHAQNRGIGRALVRALSGIAIARGCYGMWVLTDADNDAAFRTYERAGGKRSEGQVMFDWTFGEDRALTPE
jgi:ribosomal protein S18 acetylase RimI-like enzyme